MTNHAPKLDICCIQCVIDRCKERDRLLAFVKEIAKTECCSAVNHFDLTIKAEELIKEITKND